MSGERKTIKHVFSMYYIYVLYSDKTLAFDQSERAQGPIHIIKGDKIIMFAAWRENEKTGTE